MIVHVYYTHLLVESFSNVADNLKIQLALSNHNAENRGVTPWLVICNASLKIYLYTCLPKTIPGYFNTKKSTESTWNSTKDMKHLISVC